MSSIPENKRILIIDDNRAIHEDFRKVLTDTTGGSSMDAAEEALFGDAVASQPKRVTFQLEYAAQGLEGVEKSGRPARPAHPLRWRLWMCGCPRHRWHRDDRQTVGGRA